MKLLNLLRIILKTVLVQPEVILPSGITERKDRGPFIQSNLTIFNVSMGLFLTFDIYSNTEHYTNIKAGGRLEKSLKKCASDGKSDVTSRFRMFY